MKPAQILLILTVSGCADPLERPGVASPSDDLDLPADRAAPPPVGATLTVGRAIAGTTLTLVAGGFPPGTSVTFLVSSDTASPGFCPPALRPVCLAVAAPTTRIGARAANAAGVASITYTVAAPATPQLEFQAYGLRAGVYYISPGVTVDVLTPIVGAIEAQQVAFGSGVDEIQGDDSFLYDPSTSSLQILRAAPGALAMTVMDALGFASISSTHTVQVSPSALTMSDGIDTLELGWTPGPSVTSTAGLNVGTTEALRINDDAGAAGQVLTSGGPGAPPTWSTPAAAGGSLYEPDAWDVAWTTADGAPDANGWTLTAGALAPAIVDGVACFEMTPDPVVSSYLQRDLPALDGNFELRAWLRMPSEGAAVSGDYNIVSYYTGASLNKTLSLVLSSTGLSLNVSGSTLTPFAIPLGDLGMQWISVTLRVVTAGSGRSGAVIAWVGDTYAGSVPLASVSQPTIAPNGRIRIGKAYTNAGADPAWQLAFFGFRQGFNDAPATYTYRGTGFGSYGPR